MGSGYQSESSCLWYWHKLGVPGCNVSCTLQMNVHLALHLHSHLGQDECCVDHQMTLETTFNGVAMSVDQLAQLPTRTRIDPAARKPLDMSARLECGSGRPRVVRMPADWWDSPSAVGCPLSRGPQSARTARRLTRSTLR